MKLLRLLTVCALTCGVFSSCAPVRPLVYDTSYDYDIRVDFTAMRSYAWLPLPVTATITPLNADRVKYFVETRLSLKDYTVSLSRPDFLIEPMVDSTSQIDTTGGPDDYGLYREARLSLTFVLPASRNVIWRGETRVRVNQGLSPQEKDQLIMTAVDDILQNFPPPQS